MYGWRLQGILKPENDDQVNWQRKGIDEFNKVFDMTSFRGRYVCSTGRRESFLEGVKFKSWGAVTHSKVMKIQSGL